METFIVYTIAVSISVFLLYLLGISLAPYKPSDIKNEHFECGLPASSTTPKKANFGFFVYAIMFIVADMTGLFFTLFVYGTDKHSSIVASLFAIIIALAITLAMREHQRIELDAKNS
jgi:NADH-quinone oxidoreductase subunit A